MLLKIFFIVFLIIFNVFMIFVWYGYFKFENWLLYLVILVSWGIVLVEYCFVVFVNCIGYLVYNVVELKIM